MISQTLEKILCSLPSFLSLCQRNSPALSHSLGPPRLSGPCIPRTLSSGPGPPSLLVCMLDTFTLNSAWAGHGKIYCNTWNASAIPLNQVRSQIILWASVWAIYIQGSVWERSEPLRNVGYPHFSPKIQTLSVPNPAHFAKAEDQGAGAEWKDTLSYIHVLWGHFKGIKEDSAV